MPPPTANSPSSPASRRGGRPIRATSSVSTRASWNAKRKWRRRRAAARSPRSPSPKSRRATSPPISRPTSSPSPTARSSPRRRSSPPTSARRWTSASPSAGWGQGACGPMKAVAGWLRLDHAQYLKMKMFARFGGIGARADRGAAGAGTVRAAFGPHPDRAAGRAERGAAGRGGPGPASRAAPALGHRTGAGRLRADPGRLDEGARATLLATVRLALSRCTSGRRPSGTACTGTTISGRWWARSGPSPPGRPPPSAPPWPGSRLMPRR